MRKRETLSIATAFFLIFIPSFIMAQEEVPQVLDEKLQLGLGDHFFEEGDYFRAITEYRRFLFFFPQSQQTEDVHFKIVRSYLRGQKWEEALSALDRLIKKFPDSARKGEAFLLKGFAHLAKKEYAQAHYFFRKASEASPGTSVEEEAHFQAARTYIEEEKWREAARELRKITPHSRLYPQGEYIAQSLEKIEEIPQKSPLTAGFLAAVIPGAGHLYCQRYRDAALAFFLNGAFIWALIEAFNHENYALGGILTFFELGWYSGNIYSAVGSAYKYNRQRKKEYLQNLEKEINISLGISRSGNSPIFVFNYAF